MFGRAKLGYRYYGRACPGTRKNSLLKAYEEEVSGRFQVQTSMLEHIIGDAIIPWCSGLALVKGTSHFFTCD